MKDHHVTRIAAASLLLFSHAALTAAPASTIPYGIWKTSHCEYYKDGALMPAKQCDLKAEMKIAILPEQFILETVGKPPRVTNEPNYKEFPRWVEVQTGSSSDRIYTDEKNFISVLVKTPAPDINAKLYFTKIESVAAPAQPVPTASTEPVAPAPKAEAGISTQDRMQMLKTMGLTQRGKQWQNECDRPVEPKMDVTDINGDGQSEVFVMVEDSICYGMAGANLVLFIKDRQGKWQSNLGFPAGGYKLLKNRRSGFPDISIALPGPCAPIWGWNGSQYDLVKKCVR